LAGVKTGVKRDRKKMMVAEAVGGGKGKRGKDLKNVL
jgi:hypothetical protein